MDKVYGVRICRHCQGICHEQSYRQKHGIRRAYWCSDDCLRDMFKERVAKQTGIWLRDLDDTIVFEGWNEHRDSIYERVEVISR